VDDAKLAVALVFLETRCADQLPWVGKVLDGPRAMLETHSVSDLWMFVGLSLMAAEVALRYGQKPQKRSAPAPVVAG
jgi:hypothetical protein